jgi:hypothetical protein
MDETQVSDAQNANTNTHESGEKLFTRDELAKIVNAQSAKARADAEAKYQQELESLRSSQQQRNSEVSKEVDADAIYQQVQERFNQEMKAEKERQEQELLQNQMKQVANQYISKIEAGKGLYEDFDDVTKDFDPTAFPQLTFLLAGIENAADVLYDLAKNPLKLAGIDRLAERNPRQAHSELLKLANSINVNRQAQSDADNQSTEEPLDRLQSSRVSGSNGKMGVRDLRNQSWLKG